GKNDAPAAIGAASAEQAAHARASFLKSDAMGLEKIIGPAQQLPYGSWLGALAMYYCRQNGTSLTWQTPIVASPPADAPKVGRAPAGAVFRLPAAMGFLSQAAGGFTLKLNERAMLQFEV